MKIKLLKQLSNMFKLFLHTSSSLVLDLKSLEVSFIFNKFNKRLKIQNFKLLQCFIYAFLKSKIKKFQYFREIKISKIKKIFEYLIS